jgi:hypothetical protein
MKVVFPAPPAPIRAIHIILGFPDGSSMSSSSESELVVSFPVGVLGVSKAMRALSPTSRSVRPMRLIFLGPMSVGSLRDVLARVGGGSVR